MRHETTAPSPAPERSDVMAETYAMYVDDQAIHVWSYQVDVAEPDGEWRHLETLDHDEGPRLSLEYATPMRPAADGYWIYSESYDCELDCA